jgi:predicted dehydrogenase
MDKQEINESVSRRDFLRVSALGAASLSVASLLPAPMALAAENVNEKGVFSKLQPLNLTSTGEPIRLGIIGTGARARLHINAIKQFPELPIVAAADVDETRLARGIERIGKQAGIERVNAYRDYQKLLADPQVDAVVIATPNLFHREIILAALQAKKHILSEKPLGVTPQENKQIIQAADKSDRIVSYGLQLRHALRYQALKELIESGRIGAPKYLFLAEFRGDWNNKDVWLYTDPKTGQKINWRYSQKASGGTLNEKCCHYFDILNWLIGQDPAVVSCRGGLSYYQGRETWDHATVNLGYANGAEATLGLNMFAPKRLDLQIIGETGSFHLPTSENTVLWEQKSKPNEVEKIALPNETGHGAGRGIETAILRLYADFRDSIHQNRAPFVDGKVAWSSSHVAFLGELSQKERREIAWNAI